MGRNEQAQRADRVPWLFDREASKLVTWYRVRIRGARIDGRLDLYNVKVSFGLVCNQCAIAEGIELGDGETQSLSLNVSLLGDLSADGTRIKGDVFLNGGFKAEGEVRLLGAAIEEAFIWYSPLAGIQYSFV